LKRAEKQNSACGQRVSRQKIQEGEFMIGIRAPQAYSRIHKM
jgi:hypothetical protein